MPPRSPPIIGAETGSKDTAAGCHRDTAAGFRDEESFFHQEIPGSQVVSAPISWVGGKAVTSAQDKRKKSVCPTPGSTPDTFSSEQDILVPFTKSEARSEKEGTKTRATNSPGPPKRPHDDPDSHDCTSSGETRRFACHFFRMDPQKHHSCANFDLSQIKYVKQHIYRKHGRPEFYCPLCYATFDTASRRDDHLRHRDCTRISQVPRLEGISADRKAELKKYGSRGKPAEVQWYGLWGILFPSLSPPPPEAVYMGTHLQESTLLLRRVWERRGLEITRRISEGYGPEAKDIAARFANDAMRQAINLIVGAGTPNALAASSVASHSSSKDSTAFSTLRAGGIGSEDSGFGLKRRGSPAELAKASVSRCPKSEDTGFDRHTPYTFSSATPVPRGYAPRNADPRERPRTSNVFIGSPQMSQLQDPDLIGGFDTNEFDIFDWLQAWPQDDDCRDRLRGDD